MEKSAQASYYRAVRDETAYLEMRAQIQQQDDLEAKEALFNLNGINEDINKKSQRYHSRIIEEQLRLRN